MTLLRYESFEITLTYIVIFSDCSMKIFYILEYCAVMHIWSSEVKLFINERHF